MGERAVFFDADGTICDIEKGVPESAKKAIADLRANGHRAFLCTGRSRAFVTAEMEQMGFDGIIAACGTYLEYKDELLFSKEQTPEIAWKSVEILRNHGMVPVMEGPDYMYYDLDEYTDEVDWFAGLITRQLLHIYDSDVYGLSGIAIVQILTFFPVCYMMLKGLLKNIDPSMEEAARDMGAGRWKVFTTVTLPLMLPGLGNAFLVTFIESVADFANPMMIGGSYDTLATTIYLRITGGSYDTTGAAAMAVVLLCITLVLFLIQKYYLEAKTAATLTGKASRARNLIEDRSVRVPLTAICSAVSAFVIMMYIAIPFGALFKLWGRDYSLSLKWFQQLFRDDGFKAFGDSLLLSLIASPITALLSMIISYLVVKKKFRGKAFIEFVSMLAMAVPGTVLGVGYIRGFAGGVFRTGFLQGIYGTGLILVIVFVVRSLPVGTRSGISALRQIDKSIEESAYDLGAGSAKVFTSVTLPLIKDSFLSGLVTTFVRSITAISAIILLVTPRYLLITCRINEFAEKGAYGVACAYATILIAIVYAAIVLMNLCIKYFGTSRQMRRKESD